MSKLKHGHLIVIVGPSGAGKDSILKAALLHFENDHRVELVRRIITRECDPSSEVHDSVSEDKFNAQLDAGEFSVSWRANDLSYALPANVHEKINQGQLLIANGSRGAIADIRSTFSQLTVVNIVVSAEALSARLERRNRESSEQIAKRLERNKTMPPLAGDDVVTIDNSAGREPAINEFIALIGSF